MDNISFERFLLDREVLDVLLNFKVGDIVQVHSKDLQMQNVWRADILQTGFTRHSDRKKGFELGAKE